ncbi:MAG TPA: class I SAM-dependent methyltransferase [Flavisolibacter sp.]|nr:class I SAM-dependent methyltransferase [Flavisolibacter sp.]
MERIKRKPFQGIYNIIRFNWHFYFLSIMMVTLLELARHFTSGVLNIVFLIGIILMTTGIMLSLVASFFIYDYSPLYRLSWLKNLPVSSNSSLVNIHAGFDEFSQLLKQQYPTCHLTVFDFYDPVKHTEVSIKRARNAYAAYPDTHPISTDQVPLQAASVDIILLILAAHEIRDQEEREQFFQRLQKSLKKEGKVIVVEHLRDLPNFLVYNIGFFHFISKSLWKRTFQNAVLEIHHEIKITPFLSTFILQKNGTAS